MKFSAIALSVLLVLSVVVVGLSFGSGIVAAANDPADLTTSDLPGSGTSDDPYQISNASELQAMEDDLSANYTLVDDVDASETTEWNGRDGFDPIGHDPDQTVAFTGTFDGNGYTISNLTINRSSENYVGLFGYIDNGSVVRNTSLEAADVTGNNATGTLAGKIDNSVVNQSFARGTVTSTGEWVGGLVGRNWAGTVNQSYATVDVSGSDDVGGLVGKDHGNVTNSYATGNVSGDDAVGGLVGTNDGRTVSQSYATGNVTGSSSEGGLVGANSGTVTDAYWDLQSSGQNSSAGGTGLTTGQMTGTDANLNLDGFDFENTWDTNGVESLAKGHVSRYPTLTDNAQDPPPSGQLFAGGDGTEGNEYEIASWYQLDNTRDSLDANFTLVADHSERTEGYESVANGSANNEKGFDPIGENLSVANAFNGSFDGNGYTIANLTINRSSESSVGLFGYIGSEATITNTTLDAGNVSGYNEVGGLVGYNDEGAVGLSSAKGNVSGHAQIGGLVGYNNGTVNSSKTIGTVNGTNEIGGLVGYSNGTVKSSNATATVTGQGADIGGLLGRNHGGLVNSSKAMGNVSGDGEDVGGLIGENNGGTVESSSATGNVTGSSDSVGGLIGLNDGGPVESSNATGNVQSSSWEVGGLIGKNNGGTVAESYASGDVSGDDIGWVGGLVGYNPEGTVEFSYATGNVSGKWQIGGLVGETGGKVNESYATGNVSGDTDVGGLVGLNSGGTVELSNAIGDIKGTGDRVGGLVGENTGAVNTSNATGILTVTGSSWEVGGLVGTNDGGTVTESYASVDVFGDDYGQVGGLVGYNEGGSVDYAYAIGNVSGDSEIGGLVGGNYDGAVNESYATGNVSGNSLVGALVGENSGGTVTDAYWDVNTTNQTTSEGGTGLTTSQLKANTSLNFDFDNTWNVTDNGTYRSYPFLQNNTQSPEPGLELFDTVDPTAEAGSNQTVDEDTTVNFDGAGSSDNVGVTSYDWNFDDGSTGTGATPSHTYTNPGTYTVTLTVTDDAGNSDRDTLNVMVEDTTAPSISAFDATNPSGQDVKVSFDSDEQLSTISVSISGVESGTLTKADFTEIDSGDGTCTYEATYAGSSDGDYTATLETAEDAVGNDGSSGESDSVTVDSTPSIVGGGGGGGSDEPEVTEEPTTEQPTTTVQTTTETSTTTDQPTAEESTTKQTTEQATIAGTTETRTPTETTTETPGYGIVTGLIAIMVAVFLTRRELE